MLPTTQNVYKNKSPSETIIQFPRKKKKKTKYTNYSFFYMDGGKITEGTRLAIYSDEITLKYHHSKIYSNYSLEVYAIQEIIDFMMKKVGLGSDAVYMILKFLFQGS